MKVLPRALRQNNPRNDLLVLHTLGLLRSLQERHFQHEAVSTLLRPPHKVLQLSVPANFEIVVPASKHRIPRLQLQVCLSEVRPEARGRDISNIVHEIRIQTSHHERELQLLQRGGWRVVVLALLVRDS